MVDPNPPWGGLTGPPGQQNRRTMPSWMDPKGLHGDVQFLVLKPEGNAKLPANPFVIAKSIDQMVGRIDGANPTDGGNSYILKVRSFEQVRKLEKITKLIDGTPISISPHATLNSCQCVVTCRDVYSLTNEEIQENLADQGVTKVYRFVKKVNGKVEPTNSMVLTIKGTSPPAHIYFGYLRVPTRAYYPRPLICLRCGKFGHTKQRCQHDEICLTCGTSPAHTECTNDPHCLNCGGPHSAMNRSCPVQIEEQEIVRIRVDLGISQGAAVKEFQSRVLSAQNASSTVQQRLVTARTSSLPDEKDRKIQDLEQQIDQLKARLSLLQSNVDSESNSESEDSNSTMTTVPSRSTTSRKSSKRNRRNRKSSDDKSPKSNATPKKQCRTNKSSVDKSLHGRQNGGPT